MVLGAGRGPLVEAALKAAERAEAQPSAALGMIFRRK